MAIALAANRIAPLRANSVRRPRYEVFEGYTVNCQSSKLAGPSTEGRQLAQSSVAPKQWPRRMRGYCCLEVLPRHAAKQGYCCQDKVEGDFKRIYRASEVYPLNHPEYGRQLDSRGQRASCPRGTRVASVSPFGRQAIQLSAVLQGHQLQPGQLQLMAFAMATAAASKLRARPNRVLCEVQLVKQGAVVMPGLSLETYL